MIFNFFYLSLKSQYRNHNIYTYPYSYQVHAPSLTILYQELGIKKVTVQRIRKSSKKLIKILQKQKVFHEMNVFLHFL
jgi:hypothetical protein